MLKPIIQDKLLYPEILWNRAVNIYQKRGRILVLGGEKEFKKTLLFCEALFYSRLFRVSLGYPETLSLIFQKILPEECHFPLPASNKTLSFLAYEKIKKAILDFDLLVVGVGITKNQETQRLIKDLMKLPVPILSASGKSDKVPERNYKTVYFLKNEKFKENPMIDLENLAFLTNSVVILSNKIIFVASSKQIVVTKADFQGLEEILLALIAAFWAQNIKKPFESACAASYVAKIWKENFTKISDLEKAIDKAEKVC